MNCILGIMWEAHTYSEESQQQLNAFAVQPARDKRKSTDLADRNVGAHGRKETMCEMFHRISCLRHAHTHAHYYCIHAKGAGHGCIK